MTDYTSKINQLKAALERAKTERIKAEQNKENLEKRRAEIEAEIRALGVEPADIDAEITKLDAAIAADIATVENMIPAQYRG